jgi:hypothetical protein
LFEAPKIPISKISLGNTGRWLVELGLEREYRKYRIFIKYDAVYMDNQCNSLHAYLMLWNSELCMHDYP